jgi:hypothetical protein
MSIVTSSNWGPKDFGGLIIAFLVSTFLLAGSLEPIISTWDKLVVTNIHKFTPWRNPDQDNEIHKIKDEEEEKGLKEEKKTEEAQSPWDWPKWGPRRRKTSSKKESSKSSEKLVESLHGKE